MKLSFLLWAGGVVLVAVLVGGTSFLVSRQTTPVPGVTADAIEIVTVDAPTTTLPLAASSTARASLSGQVEQKITPTKTQDVLPTPVAAAPPVVVKTPIPTPPSAITASAGPAIATIVGPTTVKDSIEDSWTIILADPVSKFDNHVYSVDWGDAKDYDMDPYYAPSSVNELKHTYYALGTYTAKFTVRNGRWEEASQTIQITVVPANPDGPVIWQISPAETSIGNTVTLTGTGFTPTDNLIHFGNGILPPADSIDGKITFALTSLMHTYCPPNSAQSCTQQVGMPGPGKYQIYIENANGLSPNVQLTVLDMRRFE